MTTFTQSEILNAARISYDVNRVFSAGLGDDSIPSFDEAPEWTRDAAVQCVRDLIADPYRDAAQLHNDWVEMRIAKGWVWGPVEDAEASPPTDPYLVDYYQLPSAARAKDELVTAAIRGVLDLR